MLLVILPSRPFLIARVVVQDARLPAVCSKYADALDK